MTLEATRHGPLEGRALPANAQVMAVALAPASRWILRGGADAALAVAPAFGVEPRLGPLQSAYVGERAALWLAPDEWLLIADDTPVELEAAMAAALSGVFHSLVDVSHRQVGIDIEGPGAARGLAAGCPLDLDLPAFPVGMVVRTLFFKAEVTLWRRAAARFRLEALRSFSPYVAAALTQAAREQEVS